MVIVTRDAAGSGGLAWEAPSAGAAEESPLKTANATTAVIEATAIAVPILKNSAFFEPPVLLVDALSTLEASLNRPLRQR
jgi:hypothetical protein